MPAPASTIARNEPPRSRSSTTRSGSSGWRLRVWMKTNAPTSSTPAMSIPIVTGSVQLCVSAFARP